MGLRDPESEKDLEEVLDVTEEGFPDHAQRNPSLAISTVRKMFCHQIHEKHDTFPQLFMGTRMDVTL